MNLNCWSGELPGNQNASGRETRKATKSTMLLHHRMACLFSPGMKSKRIRPTSGVKSTMLRIWEWRKSIVYAPYRLHVVPDISEVDQIITHENEHAQNNEERVGLHRARLHNAHGITQKFGAKPNDVHQAIDH